MVEKGCGVCSWARASTANPTTREEPTARIYAPSREGTVVPLSDDHKPSNAGEARRIEAAGGWLDGP